MKHAILGMTVVTLATMAAPAMAECPSNLTVEQKMECIVVENAGYSYTPPSNLTIAQPAITETNSKK